MRRLFRMIFKNFSKDAILQRALSDTKRKNEGKIKLFNKEFNFHHGQGFYNTYKELFEKNIYDFNTKNNNPIIIDCGANMGLSVLYFAKKFPNAEIIAFEPDETVIPFIEKNIESYDLKNVKLYKKGVWTEETALTFYTDKGLGGRVGKEYKNQSPKIIKTVRLKKFLNRPIDMLKIDIEGPEYIILKDCKDLLFNVNHIFIEYHSFYDEEQHLEDLLSILKMEGFRYHLKESFSRKRPFIDNVLVNEKFDMAINVFAYKN